MIDEPRYEPARTFRYPLWFKVAVGVLFGSLLVPYFLLRDASAPVFARTVFERFAPQLAPVLRTQAALPRLRQEPTRGAYYLNGMLVEFQTARASAGGADVFTKFENAFRKTGYRTRRVTVEGRPTLVALHPKTAMLLTVRPSRDPVTGQTLVRLSQQNLSKLRDDFRAEISGIPSYPSAVGALLVQSAEVADAQSLTFTAETAPSAVADYYNRAMLADGWSFQPNPLAGVGGLTVLDFRKNRAECSILVLADPDGSETFVMITKSGDERV